MKALGERCYGVDKKTLQVSAEIGERASLIHTSESCFWDLPEASMGVNTFAPRLAKEKAKANFEPRQRKGRYHLGAAGLIELSSKSTKGIESGKSPGRTIEAAKTALPRNQTPSLCRNYSIRCTRQSTMVRSQ
jgi:hypothetical protein